MPPPSPRRDARPDVPPSVERVLAAARPILDGRSPDALREAARAVVDEERSRLAVAKDHARTPAELAAVVVDRLAAPAPTLEPVINATGVIVHTNLGRVAWPTAAIEAARAAASEPLLLELDRETGRRGRRYRVAEDLLVRLTGAEDALVTNNNAAAVALAVGLVGRGRGIAVSRGELVEIGGGVRIPEIIRRAGARLVEVGTTNRTRVADFADVLQAGLARAVLRVHPSNFRQSGFTEVPDHAELARIARSAGAIVLDDLGSGALIETTQFGLTHEPLPSDRLRAGSDLVTFSGDKLLGGPQAGLIVGRADLVARIRRDPLARAMRPDKVTLAALAATLDLYVRGLALREIPVWRAIAADPRDIRARAEAVAASIGSGEVVPVVAAIGGGALPGETLPSFGVAIDATSPDRLLASLRLGTPAVVARVEHGRVLFDLRTVEPRRDDDLARAIGDAIQEAGARTPERPQADDAPTVGRPGRRAAARTEADA